MPQFEPPRGGRAAGAGETSGVAATPLPADSRPAYESSKRLIDVVVAFVVLAFSSPLLIAIAAAIRLTSKGPILFRQQQAIGRDGRRFTLYKFRTMTIDADDSLHRQAIERFVSGQALATEERDGEVRPVYKVTHDPRVTPIGRLLRKTGLDEIPQFLNVLKGEMSVVGPRPPVVYEYQRYDERQRRRLEVKPGITGLYQVMARSEVSFERMVAIDLDYIARRSTALDLSIMLRTPWVMLSGRGAY